MAIYGLQWGFPLIAWWFFHSFCKRLLEGNPMGLMGRYWRWMEMGQLSTNHWWFQACQVEVSSIFQLISYQWNGMMMLTGIWRWVEATKSLKPKPQIKHGVMTASGWRKLQRSEHVRVLVSWVAWEISQKGRSFIGKSPGWRCFGTLCSLVSWL